MGKSINLTLADTLAVLHLEGKTLHSIALEHFGTRLHRYWAQISIECALLNKQQRQDLLDGLTFIRTIEPALHQAWREAIAMVGKQGLIEHIENERDPEIDAMVDRLISGAVFHTNTSGAAQAGSIR